MSRHNLSHFILHPAGSTENPVSGTAGHCAPDDSVTAVNPTGEGNAARHLQLHQGSFHLQAEIIETGTQFLENVVQLVQWQ
jgi:hypothetical protein